MATIEILQQSETLTEPVVIAECWTPLAARDLVDALTAAYPPIKGSVITFSSRYKEPS